MNIETSLRQNTSHPSVPSNEKQMEEDASNEVTEAFEKSSQISLDDVRLDGKRLHTSSPGRLDGEELRQTTSDTHGQGSKETGPQRDIEALERVPTQEDLYSVFTKRQRILIVFIASFAGFVSPLSGAIYFPALNSLAADLLVSSELINLTLTSYMIFQGIAPTVFGDLADMIGRRPVYIATFIIYLLANIGLALQRDYAALFVLRCLQSTGSSGTVALAFALVSDVSTSSERGAYLGYANLGFMAGPAIGPVLGGILSQYLGWQAIFWFLAIFAGLLLIFILILLPETGRNVVGNGSIPPPIWNMSILNYVQVRKARTGNTLQLTRSVEESERKRDELAKTRKVRVPNPLIAIHIILQKDIGLLLFYNSLVYTAFYCVITTIPVLYAQIYGFDNLTIGLSFIPFGVGAAVASIINGRLMDYNYRRVAKQHGFPIDKKRGDDLRHFPIEKARLQIALPTLYLGIIAYVGYGWLLDRRVHYSVPLVFLFLLGVFLNGTFNVASVMLVDYYPQSPATATSANNLVRCLMGAGGTAAIIQMVDAMGRGWCFTFIALVLLVLSPIYWVLLWWGAGWREERFLKFEAEKERKTAVAAAAAAAGDDIHGTKV